MTYAFHTPDKLCFVLDLMNGGDLHYHLSQHGVFNEQEMRFYAAEVILGKKNNTRKRVLLLCLFIFTTIIKEIIGGTVNMGGKDYTRQKKRGRAQKVARFSLAREISKIAQKKEEHLYFVHQIEKCHYSR